jgi:maltooligosyltrehalose trehalohydrolase
MKTTGRQHYLIVELDLNDTKFIEPVEQGGFGMDAQWVDEFHHALRVTSGQERSGYYSDFTGIQHLAKAYTDAYVYDGQYSPHRNKFFGVKTTGAAGKQFIVFSQNHDQVGNRMLGERSTELVSFEMQKLMAGAVLVSPFVPMLFMGEEWSEPHRFQYFVSHTDPALAEAVRRGRKEEFNVFHIEGEAPDPVSEETFNSSRLQWHLLEEGRHKAMHQFYKALIQLRKDHAALRNLDRKAITVDFSADDQTLFVHRRYQDSEALCLMNFSKEPKTIHHVKAGEWTIVLDSADATWNGNGAAVIQNNTIRMHGESIAILTSGKSTDFIVTI